MDGYRQVFGSFSLTFAIYEELGSGVIGIDEYGSYFSFAAFPVPMG